MLLYFGKIAPVGTVTYYCTRQKVLATNQPARLHFLQNIRRIIDKKCAEYSLEKKTHEVMRQARKATYTQIAIEHFLPSLHPNDPRRNVDPESVVIPSCMKWAVRNCFPDPNERYTGHGTSLSECENNSSSTTDSHMTTPQHQEGSTVPHVQSVTGTFSYNEQNTDLFHSLLLFEEQHITLNELNQNV